MAAVSLAAAAALLVVLMLRERMWRRTIADLRRQLAARAADMREQERRAQVTQVVSGLAQELKSPLQGVIGNTEVMLATGSLNQASTADLREIQENATRAAGIVRHLLAFTETQALARRWQDMNELARRACDAMKGELGASSVRVNLTLAERLPLIYVDGRQLEKVIATLLARPTGSISGAAVPVGPIALTTRVNDAGDRVIIELDDRAGDVDEAAWSGDLAACRQILQAHGGTIEVVAGASGRFRFYIELPVATIESAAVCT
jgi:signal transduction histidine kinase